ncbi:MAG TPA: hypothetical protein PK156_32265 [Polyangium sp.]|nr:hypothetical protein [Polyangium sp.]
MYGLPPLAPDVKHAQQQALAECLEGAALDVQAKLRARTGIERSANDVQRELATRVMNLYFKRDNEHLRRVKHALRDLPREFHARITEALQMLLRDSHDAEKPRPEKRETKLVETNRPVTQVTSMPANAAQVITAREARRLLDTLGGASSRDEAAVWPSGPRELPMRPNHQDVASSPGTGQDKPRVRDKPGPMAARA